MTKQKWYSSGDTKYEVSSGDRKFKLLPEGAEYIEEASRDPAKLGLPPEFPRDTRTVVTFKDLGKGKTEMIVTEYGMPTSDTEMGKNAEIGLNQSLDKMAAIFAKV